MTFPDPAANQPPWIPACLYEVESRASKMTAWEAAFIRSIRPRVKMSLYLTEKQIETLRKIRFRLYRPEKVKRV